MIEQAKIFLEIFAQDLDRYRAHKESGLDPRTVRKLTEPRFAQYDPEFTDQYLGLIAKIDEEMFAAQLVIARTPEHPQHLTASREVSKAMRYEYERVELAHIEYLMEEGRKRLMGSTKAKLLDHGERMKEAKILSMQLVRGSKGSFKEMKEITAGKGK